MNIELINTGTELLLGSILNTHLQWLGAELAKSGFPVTRQVAIPDSGPEIKGAVRDAMQRAQLIITTGGLGPTSDDITRELIAELFESPLHLDQAVVQNLENFFAARKRIVPQSALRQAMVPEGAMVLANANGTAPGLVLRFPVSGAVGGNSGLLIMLPGPPRELQPMFTQQVIPLLEKEFGKPAFQCCTFKTTGLGEIFVEQRIAPQLEALVSNGIELGYCAKVGEVEVRVVARMKESVALLPQAETIIRTQLGHYLFAESSIPLEALVVRLLTERNQTLALAESCTGGFIAHRITNVPGASAVFQAGLVTYSNESKRMLLGVQPETLTTHGAVSEDTAREMAEGARAKHKTDFAIAVTGIAGPGGGSEEKPVGTVFIALATPHRTIVEKNFNPYDRETFKFITSQQGLDLLRKELLAVNGD